MIAAATHSKATHNEWLAVGSVRPSAGSFLRAILIRCRYELRRDVDTLWQSALHPEGEKFFKQPFHAPR
jgi:hypothetical protein